MRYLLIALIFLAGALQPIQAGMNATFAKVAGHPFQATVLNMWIGATAILLLALALGLRPPGPKMIAAAPWWSLCGGFIGATIVTSMLFGLPRLGAALLIAVFVCGQVLCSLAVDHWGWVGTPIKPLNAMRFAGVSLVIAGVVVLERAS